MLHGLPLTYNKDLQEDKERLFDAVDTLELTVLAAAGMLAGITFNRERMAAAAADEFPAATDIADLLVRRGVPFREAHGIVAGLVRKAIDSGRSSPSSATTSRHPSSSGLPRAAGRGRLARIEGLGGRHLAAARARAARARPRGRSAGSPRRRR